MKYLKKYKIFETLRFEDKYTGLEIKEIIDTCKDILLELEDKGFGTSVDLIQRRNSVDGRIKIIITISKTGIIYYEDIDEVIKRLEDYLGDFNLYIEIPLSIQHLPEKWNRMITYNRGKSSISIQFL